MGKRMECFKLHTEFVCMYFTALLKLQASVTFKSNENTADITNTTSKTQRAPMGRAKEIYTRRINFNLIFFVVALNPN